MKSNRTDEQLQAFFKEDPMYLKKYVREHPDNKMAWYLLGRDYEAQGKKGKALYCYAQAGEIYEAYENQTITLTPEDVEPLHQWRAHSSRRNRLRWLRMALLTMALFAAIVAAPDNLPETPPQAALPSGVTPQQLQETTVYYLAGPKNRDSLGSALQQMLLQERVASYGILARGIPIADTSLIGWLHKPEMLLSVSAGADASKQQIDYFDAESCNCKPSDATKAAQVVAAWMTQQEEQLVVRSAVAGYIRRHGQTPASSAQIIQPYPDNGLSGFTPSMQAWYERNKESVGAEMSAYVKGQQPGGEGAPAATADSGAPVTAQLTKPLTEPLRIVVDKSQYRLAVLSGNLLVRSYPVGLGGTKTPEGTFVISEKVRNPNGKSNGDFGSRGMTLSDTLYAIHGTNKPGSIEKDQSLGCIRMLKEDVEELFDLAPLGTPVTIGKGLLTDEIQRSPEPFHLPLFIEETNPAKVYKWLD